MSSLISSLGVMVLHRGLVALQSTERTRIFSKPGRRIAQFLSPAFGGCVFEIFAALCYGATLVLRKDDSNMISHLDDVHAAILTPSVAAELDASKFPNIQYVRILRTFVCPWFAYQLPGLLRRGACHGAYCESVVMPREAIV